MSYMKKESREEKKKKKKKRIYLICVACWLTMTFSDLCVTDVTVWLSRLGRGVVSAFCLCLPLPAGGGVAWRRGKRWRRGMTKSHGRNGLHHENMAKSRSESEANISCKWRRMLSVTRSLGNGWQNGGMRCRYNGGAADVVLPSTSLCLLFWGEPLSSHHACCAFLYAYHDILRQALPVL